MTIYRDLTESVSYPRQGGWMDQPTPLKRVDQTSRNASSTSFNHKNDALHARILELLYLDSTPNMSEQMHRGLANCLHFLIMRDMHNAIDAQRIIPEGVGLIYQHYASSNWHRVPFKVADAADENADQEDGSVSLHGEWVRAQSQALDSLRSNVERAIYGDE